MSVSLISLFQRVLEAQGQYRTLNVTTGGSATVITATGLRRYVAAADVLNDRMLELAGGLTGNWKRLAQLITFALARPAISPIPEEIGIFRREIVSANATLLRCLLASAHVLLVRHRLKVFWVYAASVTAEVVWLKPIWDRAYEMLIGPAMSNGIFTSNTECSVSMIQGGLPLPAATLYLLDLRHEPAFKRRIPQDERGVRRRVAIMTEPRSVGRAQSKRLRWLVADFYGTKLHGPILA